MGSKIRDSDGGWVFIGERLVRVPEGGGACTIPVAVGVSRTSASILHFDHAHILRELVFETEGAIRLEFWRSVNSPDPANQAAIDAALDAAQPVPEPDLSNIKWLFAGEKAYSDPGMHPADPSLLGNIRGSRYLKIDKTHGSTLTIHALSAGN